MDLIGSAGSRKRPVSSTNLTGRITSVVPEENQKKSMMSEKRHTHE